MNLVNLLHWFKLPHIILPYSPVQYLQRVRAYFYTSLDKWQPPPLHGPAGKLAECGRTRLCDQLQQLEPSCDSDNLDYKAWCNQHANYFSISRSVADANLEQDEETPTLWHYHFHYHSEFPGSARWISRERLSTNDCFRSLVHWINQQQKASGIAWHPFVTATRIINWIRGASQLNTEEQSVFNNNFGEALYTQLRFLMRRCEWHSRGNHLVRNIAALVLGGVYFDSQEANLWYRIAIKELENITTMQILPDGTHRELSPMYHGAVLMDLILIASAIESRDNECPLFLLNTIKKMTRVLQLLCRPNGTYAHFNDSGEGVVPPAKQIIYAAEKLIGTKSQTTAVSQRLLLSSGYFIWTDSKLNIWFLADICAVGAPDCPGHIHSDALSFELAIDNKLWFVNLGTHGYKGSPFETFCRSVPSHNTLDYSVEQVERWDSFRVGRLPAVKNYGLSTFDNKWETAGSCRPYGSKATHYRRFNGEIQKTSAVWSVTDHFYQQQQPVHTYLHCAPEVIVKNCGKFLLLSRLDSNFLVRVSFSGYTVKDLVQLDQNVGFGCYFPAYGSVEPCTSIIFSAAEKRTAGFEITAYSKRQKL